MQIQFKQAEIVAALKQYIAAQGINTNGKSVEVTFSATRGAAGIIADVTIEDVAIPGFTDSEVDEAIKASEAPALKVVPTTKAEPAEEPAAVEAPDAAKTTSLFN